MEVNIIYNKNCLIGLKDLPDNSIDTCVTSPPYWNLRDYGSDDQIGNETSFNDYLDNLISIFNEIYRVLKPTGTCFVNIGDVYAGSGNGSNDKNKLSQINGKARINSKPHPKTVIRKKSLLMLPERFAIRMIDNGWILRNQIIWHKRNQMPSSVKDRFTVDFEKIFFFVKKSKGYYFDQQLEQALGYDGRKDIFLKKSVKYDEKMNGGIKNPNPRWKFKNLQKNGQQKNHTFHENRAKGIPDKLYPVRNMRTVWSVNTKPFKQSHFAVFPEKLVKRMITSGCPENGIVLDPFMGAGTTAVVAKKLNRNYIGFELNSEYIKISDQRLYNELGLFS